MKHELIMENWRKFVTEAEQTKNYGDLYLFEDDTVQKVSFYDRLMSLNESEHDFDVFFEQWEKSAHYELDRLNEIDLKTLKENPVLYLSTQAYLLIARAKDKVLKYIGKIKAVINKASAFLERFKERNPTVYKVGALAIKVAIALVVLVAISAILNKAQAGTLTDFNPAGGDPIADPDQLQSLGELLQDPAAPEAHKELGKKLIDLAQSAFDMDTSELASQLDGLETMELETFVKKGVAKLAETSPDAGDAAQSALETMGELAASGPRVDIDTNMAVKAINLIGKATQGAGDINDSAIQALKDLADQAGAPDVLQGVDLESLSKEQLFDLADQIGGSGSAETAATVAGEAGGVLDKIRKLRGR